MRQAGSGLIRLLRPRFRHRPSRQRHFHLRSRSPMSIWAAGIRVGGGRLTYLAC
jgi:hypothetical protein